MPKQEIKAILNGGMDLDTDPSVIGKNRYINALNITTDAVQANNDQAITNLVANRKVNYAYPSGTGKVIGQKVNNLRNTILFFRYNSNGYHGIYEYNHTTRVISKILENLTDTNGVDILSFTADNKITGVDIYNRDEGDLLLFLDSLGRPTGLDIEKFRAGTYTPVTRRIIDKAKCPPLLQPFASYGNNTVIRTNNTAGKLFRFRFRKVFDSFEKSTFSPYSKVPLPAKITDETYTNIITNNNFIGISFQLTNLELDCKSIEVGVSIADKTNAWSDLQTVATIERKDFGVIDANGNVTIFYNFFNDGTYPFFNTAESDQDWDWVPDKANGQALLNGKIIAYIGITEGYNKDLITNVAVEVDTYDPSAGSPGSFNAVLTDISTTYHKIDFSGSIIPGVIVTLTARRISTGSIDTIAIYTIVARTPPVTLSDIAASFAAGINGYGRGLGANSAGATTYISDIFASHDTFVISITIPFIGLADSISTHKWSTSPKLALYYQDRFGKSNGVLYSTKVTMPAYAETAGHIPLLPYIHASIYHQPPVWAESFQWLLTQEAQTYFFWNTTDILYTDTNYIYFNISNIVLNQTKKPSVTNVVFYAFQNGDRMRLIRRNTDNTVFDDTYDAAIEGVVTNPNIPGATPTVTSPVTGTFLKIKKIAPLSTVDFSSNQFVIEMYNNQQQTVTADTNNEAFYEFGEGYKVLFPGTANRSHQGGIADQVVTGGIPVSPATFDFKNGQSYFRSRTVYLSDAGFSTYYVQDRNFVDFFTSAVNSVQGRATIIDTNARKAYYGTLIRHSEAVQADTNINGLNRIYSTNFDEYDVSYGDALAIIQKNRELIVLQKLKIGHFILYASIGKDANGSQVTFQTDKLLNPIQYYDGDYGIGTCPESLASFNFAIYGCDNIRGVIWRLSNDGLVVLSQLYKVNSWANDELILRTGKNKVYGAFDQRLKNYIAALEAVVCQAVSVPAFTLPDGFINTAYSLTVTLTGTLDFTLSNIAAPSWMTISLSGFNLVFSGTPTVEQMNAAVSFTISNDCGTANIGTLNFNVNEVQTGIMLEFGGLPTAVPTGYLLCDHSAVSRTTYAALFAVIGVLHGAGDGTTTFNLPDTGKRVSAGYSASGSGYNVTGQQGGNAANSFAATIGISNFPPHSHKVAASGDATSLNTPFGANDPVARSNTAEGTNAQYRLDPLAGGTATIGNSSSVGSGTPLAIDVTNMYIVLPKIIKT